MDQLRVDSERFLQCGRRTGGPGEIPSGIAVGDGDHEAWMLRSVRGFLLMVGLPPENRKAPVELLYQYQAGEPVGKHQGGERESLVGPLSHLG